jgi:hypothetical protein
MKVLRRHAGTRKYKSRQGFAEIGAPIRCAWKRQCLRFLLRRCRCSALAAGFFELVFSLCLCAWVVKIASVVKIPFADV